MALGEYVGIGLRNLFELHNKKLKTFSFFLMTKICGIYEGLKMVVEQGCLKAIVKSDLKDAVDIINKVRKKKFDNCNLVHQIYKLMGRMEIVHIYMEANGYANFLAKLKGGCKIFQGYP